MEVVNTLAYFDTETVTDVKSFIVHEADATPMTTANKAAVFVTAESVNLSLIFADSPS